MCVWVCLFQTQLAITRLVELLYLIPMERNNIEHQLLRDELVHYLNGLRLPLRCSCFLLRFEIQATSASFIITCQLFTRGPHLQNSFISFDAMTSLSSAMLAQVSKNETRWFVWHSPLIWLPALFTPARCDLLGKEHTSSRTCHVSSLRNGNTPKPTTSSWHHIFLPWEIARGFTHDVMSTWWTWRMRAAQHASQASLPVAWRKEKSMSSPKYHMYGMYGMFMNVAGKMTWSSAARECKGGPQASRQTCGER